MSDRAMTKREREQIIEAENHAAGLHWTPVSTCERCQGLEAEQERTVSLDELRLATWRLSNAASSLARHAKYADDPAHRAWFRSAIGDVEREIGLARVAAGPEPDYARAALAQRDHRPSETFEDGSPPVCVLDDETWPCAAALAQRDREEER